MNPIELQINKIAQGSIILEDGVEWFNACDLKSKKEILQSLSYFLIQSHPTRNEIEAGIKLSGLKSTYTPCALMNQKPVISAINKIRNLPENEWEKSFTLWVTILGISDKRRRETDCVNGCSHEWHNIKNL